MTADRFISLLAHYRVLQGCDLWSFTVEVVPGLTFQGDPAWATVSPELDANGKLRIGPDGRYHAHVKIRDVDATPIPGFDGDVMREIRVTISHELWHCKVREFLDDPSVEKEEVLVEAAAQAVVTSEGTVDARIMARSIKALPSALRARVSASAGRRARGGMRMNPEMVKKLLDAIEAGDQEAMKECCKQLVAEAASGGAAADPAAGKASPSEPGEQQGKTEPPVQAADDKPVQGQDARVSARGDGMSEDARRARVARQQAEESAAELKAMADAQRPAAKEAIVQGLRARLGPALTTAAEKRIMGAATYQRAKEIAEIVEESIGGGEQRARSGVEHGQSKARDESGAAPMTAEQLKAEGFSEQFVKDYFEEHRADPKAAAATLAGGRARLGKNSNPWARPAGRA